MKTASLFCSAATASLFVSLAAGICVAQAADDLKRFVTCPVYRDTDAGKKTGCWLADEQETGTRYDVTGSPTKPQIGHAILVEGFSSSAPNICGGVVMKPVRVAVLEERCKEFLLPAEGFPSAPFVLPSTVLRAYYLPEIVPPGPYSSREFQVFFDFNDDFLIYQYSDFVVEEMARYIKASKPKRVVVTGYAATEPLTVSGRTLSEDPKLAKIRAEKVADALMRLGVAKSLLKVEWRNDPQPVENGSGLAEPSKRRVTIALVV